jgi:1-phosphofructokinase
MSTAGLAILAPSPVLTVTVEMGDDQGDETHFHAGGQGIWVARMAGALGGEVVLCVALAGEAGVVLDTLLRSPGVEVRSVRAHGRSGSYIHDRRQGERVAVAATTGPRLLRHETDELYGIMLSAALDAKVAMLTGPQPADALAADFYRHLAADLRANGLVVIADVTDGALAGALAGGLDLLKISHEELIDEGLAVKPDRESLFAGMRELRRRGARTVLVSRAIEPALVMLDDRFYEIVGPRFEPRDPSGAGDSMFAAIGVAMARGANPIDAIRLGAAAGALNVTRRGLGSGHRSEIERLVSRVDAIEVRDQPAAS